MFWRGESYGNTADAESGEERRDLYAQVGESEKNEDEPGAHPQDESDGGKRCCGARILLDVLLYPPLHKGAQRDVDPCGDLDHRDNDGEKPKGKNDRRGQSQGASARPDPEKHEADEFRTGQSRHEYVIEIGLGPSSEFLGAAEQEDLEEARAAGDEQGNGGGGKLSADGISQKRVVEDLHGGANVFRVAQRRKQATSALVQSWRGIGLRVATLNGHGASRFGRRPGCISR
jgi:hypothetical protein